MVRFYGVMLHMSIETHHLGGREGCFKTKLYIIVVCGYTVKIVWYRGWTDMIMTIERFHHIISNFHPEAGEYDIGENWHQLRYLIRSVNDSASKTFELGPTYDLDEGGIATHSRFCCVRQYNKYNPYKLRIGLFFLTDSTQYFVMNIGV